MRRMLILATSLALGACIDLGDRVVGSGEVVTEPRTVSSFDRIALQGRADVEIAVGAPQTVRVQAQKNIADLIETSASGGTLRVSERKNFTTDRPAIVRITVPNLSALSLRGSSSATITGARGPSLRVDISGAGNVEATGKVRRLTLDASGVGNANLRGLTVEDAVVRVSGVGNARIGEAKTLDVAIYGVGSVTYLGSPRILHQQINGIGHLSRD